MYLIPQYKCSILIIHLDSRPELKHLHNLVSPNYAATWRKIGHYLGLEDGQLDIIDHDHYHRAEDCCDTVLEQWLDTDTTATWDKVIKAIESPVVLWSTVTSHLREHYINDSSTTSENEWSFYQPDYFTSVALVHHKHKYVSFREVIAVASVMHKGKVTTELNSNEPDLASDKEYFSSCKISGDLSALFSTLKSGNKNIPTRLLIEGAPGIGKTILSKEIAFEWATEKLLNDKELLFLIILRDPHVQKITMLQQFVSYAIKTSDIKMVTSVVQYLEETSGKHCTIVFDGYDELSEENRNDSFVAKIIKHKVLKLCSVVITSRHSASSSLHGDVDCRVEILGFTKEKRDEYINQCLKDNSKKIKVIQEYLMVNPFIDGLCYILLNMAILIYLVLESDASNLPKNQTEINDQFTFATISRYLRKEHNIEHCGKTYQGLPSHFKQHFDVLCELAYIFLGMDKIVFNDDDIKQYCPKLLRKWNTLGLLKVVKYHSFLKDTPLVSYNFLHFSIQEFLAAYHIHTLKDKNEIKSLKNNFWNPRYLNASVMYVGLTKGNSFALRHFLSGHKFRFVTKWSKSTRISTSTISNKVKSLHLLQCFSEAGNDELIRQLGSFTDDTIIDLSGNALLSKDIQMLSFFLTRSTTKDWKMLNLSQCYMGDNTFDVFCKTFSGFNENKVVISAVDLSYNQFTPASLKGIVDLICCFDVKHLYIHGNYINKEEFDNVLFAVSNEGKINIELQVGEYDHYFINNEFSDKEMILPDFQSDIKYNFHLWSTTCPLDIFLACVVKGISMYRKEVNCSAIKMPQQKYKVEGGESVLQSNVFAKLLLLSENPYMHTSVCVASMEDDLNLGAKILSCFQECNKTNCTCVVISKSKLMVYGEAEQEIQMVFTCSSKNIDTAILLNCSYAELALFKIAPSYWNTIDLSGCSIGHESIEKLAFSFSRHVKEVYIIRLNLSNNNFHPSSLIKLLSHCIVENLIVSQMLEHGKFHEELCNCYIRNFLQNVPMVVTITTINYIYLPTSYFDLEIIQNVMCNHWNHCSVFYFAELVYGDGENLNDCDKDIQHCLSIDYINSVFKLKSVKVSTINRTIKEFISILLDGLILSHQNIATIDLFDCNMNTGICNMIFESFFNETNLLDHIDLLDLTNNEIPETHIYMIIESLYYCIVERLKVSAAILNSFTDYLTSFYTSQNIKPLNFIHGVPLSVISYQELEDNNLIDNQAWTSQINTFLINYSSDVTLNKVLNTLKQDMQFTTQHSFHIYNSFIKGNDHLLQKLLVLLQNQFVDIVIYEVNLPDNTIRELVNALTWFGHRIQYVLTSKTMIYAHNSNSYQIVQAIRSTSPLASVQNIIEESPIYINTCFDTLSLNISYHWHYVHLTDCQITDEDLANIQMYFNGATIKILKLSCKDLSLLAVVKFVLNCCSVQNLYYSGHYEGFHVCEILSSLLPSASAKKLQIEITFKYSIAFILHGSDSHIEDFLTSAINSTKPVHLLILNCKLSDNLVRIVLKSFSGISNLSSVHLHNTSLQPHHCLSVIKLLLHVDLFISEENFLFTSSTSCCYCEHEKLHGARFEMQWTDQTYSQIKFMFKELKYVIDIINELTGTKMLHSFTISNVDVTDEAVEDITSVIANNSLSNIKMINLTTNDKNMMIILKELQNIKSLKHFAINSINIVNHCQWELYHTVIGNRNLEYLEISKCNLTESTIIKIAEALNAVEKSLICLNLSNNVISDSAATKLALVLRKTSSLEHLDLSSTELQIQGIINIAQSLKVNTCLKTLHFNNCTVTNEANEVIVSCVLNKLTSLECLEFSNCKLEEISIICISKALSNMSTLNTLDFSMNKITDIAASSLAAVITNNTGIRCLKLSIHSMNEVNAIKILSSCRNLTNLICVDINFSHFSACFSKDGNCYSIFDFIHNIPIDDVVGDPQDMAIRNIKQITHLTLSNCSYVGIFYVLLPLTSLEYLDVNSSTIPFATISANIANNTKLKHIDISNCLLQNQTFLEIAKAMSTLVLLRHLNISGIEINNSSAIFVAATICCNPGIHHLNLSKCQLQSNGLLNIIKQLKYLKWLSYLDLGYNYFTIEAANELADVFTQYTKLEHLCLCHCNLYELSFLPIAKSLTCMASLKHLSLSRNIFNAQISSTIHNCIVSNCSLSYFDISHCVNSDSKIQIITASLRGLNSLKHLNISLCKVNCSAVNDLVAVINRNTGLQHLDISNCHMKEDGMLKITQALLQLHSLRYVNFQSNIVTEHIYVTIQNVSSNSTGQLISIINNNKLLEYFNLSSCWLSTSQRSDILKALAKLTNLQYFNVSNNDTVAVEMASVINNNKSLEALDVSNCSMSEHSFSIVLDALSHSRHLTTLNLSSNKVTYNTSLVLASFLKSNNVIEYLDLSHCNLTVHEDEDGLFNVVSALKYSICLKHLNLESNIFTEKTMHTLYDVVCVNQKIEYLNLKQCDLFKSLLENIITQCRGLKYLNISYNTVTEETACVLSSAIRNRSLECVNISDCIVEQKNTKIIVYAITSDTQLLYSFAEKDTNTGTMVGVLINNMNFLILKLSCNPLMDHLNIVKLMYYFKLTSHYVLEKINDFIVSDFSNVKCVEYLEVSNCDSSVYLILKAIQQYYTLRYLIFKSSTIPNTTLYYILNAIYNNSNLIHVDLSDCNLSGSQTLNIAKSLGRLSNLKHLNVSSNEITNEAIDVIASVITGNKLLEHLHINNCSIDHDGIQTICRALSHITTLLSLNISNNHKLL